MAGKPGQNQDGSTLRKMRVVLESESSDSLRLLKRPDSNPICSIDYDKSIPCVTVTWHGYATSAQLRFIHEHIVHLLQEYGATKVLGDDGKLATIHGEDQRWIVHNWMPRALAAGLKAVATKKPNGYFGKRAVENIQAHLTPHLAARSFVELNDAKDWLRQI